MKNTKMYNLMDGDAYVVAAICGNCGSIPVFINHNNVNGGYTIRCPNCGNCMTSYKSSEHTEKLWNEWMRDGMWPKDEM